MVTLGQYQPTLVKQPKSYLHCEVEPLAFGSRCSSEVRCEKIDGRYKDRGFTPKPGQIVMVRLIALKEYTRCLQMKTLFLHLIATIACDEYSRRLRPLLLDLFFLKV
jgi:hypothetical protein